MSLEGANLKGVKLDGVRFIGCNFNNANLSGMEVGLGISPETVPPTSSNELCHEAPAVTGVRHTEFCFCTFYDADLSGATFTQARFEYGSGFANSYEWRGGGITNSQLVRANLANASIPMVDFSGSNLRDACFLGADLSKALLGNAILASTTCPDGINSDESGGNCIFHLDHEKCAGNDRWPR